MGRRKEKVVILIFSVSTRKRGKKSFSHCETTLFSEFFGILFKAFLALFWRSDNVAMTGATESLPKSIQRNWLGEFRKTWKTLNVLNETGKCHASLVSLIIPLLWPEWFTSYFATCWKIFLKIINQTRRTNAWPKTTFFLQNRS